MVARVLAGSVMLIAATMLVAWLPALGAFTGSDGLALMAPLSCVGFMPRPRACSR